MQTAWGADLRCKVDARNIWSGGDDNAGPIYHAFLPTSKEMPKHSLLADAFSLFPLYKTRLLAFLDDRRVSWDAAFKTFRIETKSWSWRQLLRKNLSLLQAILYSCEKFYIDFVWRSCGALKPMCPCRRNRCHPCQNQKHVQRHPLQSLLTHLPWYVHDQHLALIKP